MVNLRLTHQEHYHLSAPYIYSLNSDIESWLNQKNIVYSFISSPAFDGYQEICFEDNSDALFFKLIWL
jgi:hypothetical protein